jgi:hypothetical protein
MGRKIIISEDDKNHISKIYGLINEQSGGHQTSDKIVEFSGKTVDEIHKMIENNVMIKSGGRLIENNSNLMKFTNTFKVDAPQLKSAGIPFLMGQCLIGTYTFDLTFYIKEGKVKMVIDNFQPSNLRKVISGGGGSNCPAHYQNAGVTMKEPPNQNKLSIGWGVWSYMTKMMNGNMPKYLESVTESLMNPQSGVTDPYDF